MTKERFTALHTIDLVIASELDREAVLEVVVEQAVSRLSVDAADVLLWNPDHERLGFAAGKGFRTAAPRHTKLSLGDGYAGRVAAEGRMLHIDLAEATEFRRSELLPEEGFVEYYGVALIARGELKGVLEVFTRTPHEPDAEWLDFLELLAGQAAIAIDNAILIADLKSSKEEVVESYDRTLEGWSKALDLRDKDTEGHSQRVTAMTIRLARAMGLGEDELVHVRRGALLHDIGKLGVPDSILHKPGPLTDEEWDIMRLHPIYAYELLFSIPFLLPALDIPYCHHERWDGTGYPRRLKGEEIPLVARIFAVADAWDTLRSDRPYQKAVPAKKALADIRESAGSHLDPEVVEAFQKLVQQGMLV